VNSKQIVAAISALILIVILVYPTFSTGALSAALTSTKIAGADHVYATVGNLQIHHTGRPESEGWEVVYNQTQTVDLVLLQNTTLNFPKGQVPLGSYDSIRMYLTNVTWVFNQTYTRLSVQSTQVEVKLDFTSQGGRAVSVALVLSGHQEVLQGNKFFVSTLKATLGLSS
jgi:hypothetical protein